MATETTPRLSSRERTFVDLYLTNGGNVAQAATTAGYSPHTADSQGKRLLAQVGISAEIARREADALVGNEDSLARWRRELTEDTATARDSGNLSATMKGHELLGRHLGAFTDTQQSQSETAFIAFLAGYAGQQASRLSQEQQDALPEGEGDEGTP